MIVHYHEAAVLCAVSRGRGAPVLDDYHRSAWEVFTGKRHHKGAQRPFVFAFHPIPPGRDLLRIRSAQPFTGASARSLELDAGCAYTLRWLFVPEGRDAHGRRVVPPTHEWADSALSRLRRNGFDAEPDALAIEMTGCLPVRRGDATKLPVARAQGVVRVADELTAANAWLGGVARMAAFGMGMLEMVNGSEA